MNLIYLSIAVAFLTGSQVGFFMAYVAYVKTVSRVIDELSKRGIIKVII